MTIRKIHCAAVATLFGVLPVVAQSAGNGDEEEMVVEAGVIEFVRTTPEISALLNQARPVEPNAIPTPKFAIRTRDNSFVLSIGGKINPILGYDIGNDLYDSDEAGSNFITGDIPVPAATGHKSAFFINPLNAFVDFTVVGLGGTDNQVTGYVKIGMNGSNHNALLKRAYVTWRGFTVGEAATLMADGLAQQPPQLIRRVLAAMLAARPIRWLTSRHRSAGSVLPWVWKCPRSIRQMAFTAERISVMTISM